MSEFVLSAFADEISPDLDRQIDVLLRQDIRYVELRGVGGKSVADFTPEEAYEVYDALRAAGIGVSAVGSPIGKVSVMAPFESHFSTFRRVVELAQIFETPYIRMFSFFIPDGDNPGMYRDAVLNRLTRMVEYARREDVVLLHENEKHIYGDTALRCLDLMRALHGENFAMTYDPSNFVQCGEKNYPDAFELLRPYIRYVHMKDSVRQDEAAPLDTGFDRAVVSDAHRPAGEGDGDVVEILRALHRGGYEGFLSIEPHLSNNPLCGNTGEDVFAVAAYAVRRSIQQALKEEAL